MREFILEGYDSIRCFIRYNLFMTVAGVLVTWINMLLGSKQYSLESILILICCMLTLPFLSSLAICLICKVVDPRCDEYKKH